MRGVERPEDIQPFLVLGEPTHAPPTPQPEDELFAIWIQTHPQYGLIVQPNLWDVSEVIGILSSTDSFIRKDPDFFNHHRRLALTIRYIKETYDSPQEIYEIFGLNPRTVMMFMMEAEEPRSEEQYAQLWEWITQLKEQKQQFRRGQTQETDESLQLVRIS